MVLVDTCSVFWVTNERRVIGKLASQQVSESGDHAQVYAQLWACSSLSM